MSHPVTVDALRIFAEKFVEQEAGRLGSDGWWQTPLLAAAPIDSRFDRLPQIMDYFSDLPQSTHVCGKCAALMPCSFKNPVSVLETSGKGS